MASQTLSPGKLHKMLYLFPLDQMHVPKSFPTAFLAWLSLMVTFHTVCGFLELCDRRKWLQRFRRQPAGDSITYAEMMPRILFNQVVLMLPAMLLSERLALGYNSRVLFNSVPSLAACLAVMGIGHDVIFYIGHRYLLHSRWGYKRFGHDLHHSTKANCAAGAFYMVRSQALTHLASWCWSSPCAEVPGQLSNRKFRPFPYTTRRRTATFVSRFCCRTCSLCLRSAARAALSFTSWRPP
mmetsp:Transcript_526/g.1800  ORF Transcript_526/g.1800 Transcript_526/m.1800 type:complete len:239 (-) Transcript_526:461-1177(-)